MTTSTSTGILVDKKIILGVCGGIAAYKSVELLRLLTKNGADVRVVMTDNARYFVGTTTFEALSGKRACASLFEETDDAAISHIEWAKAADAVIIAPATANLVGKLANGIADDALSTFLMAVTAPIIICPSMNTHMYESPAVQRNMEILKSDGRWVLAPGIGELACGTTGPGRLPEPHEILDRLISRLTKKDYVGCRILVTAGPTQEAIDPVRFISNPSSGKMGYAIARAAEHRGAVVTLISGPTNLAKPLNVKTIQVRTALEMRDAVFDNLDDADVIIKAAAVSDYRSLETADHKIKKDQDEMVVHLTRNPDIVKEIGRQKGNRIVVGFAAETRDLEKNALTKLREKHLDMIAGNLIGSADSGFVSDTNRITLFFKEGRKESLDLMEKDAAAHVLLDRIADLMQHRGAAC